MTNNPMIYGVGIDLVDVARIRESIKKLGPRFIKRIAHPDELAMAPTGAARAAEYWAGRFAVKEAFAKALGTGIGSVVALKDVGAVPDEHGKPVPCYSKRLRTKMTDRGIMNAHFSLSHTVQNAVAIVILERGISAHENRQ